jgi:hypothetical protein
MGSDKGKARKAWSYDKAIDRLADSYYSNPNPDPSRSAVADALMMRSSKRHLSKTKRQSLVDLSNQMQAQFASKRAQEIINDQQGGPKMKMKGFGN